MDNELIITRKPLQGEDNYKVFSIRVHQGTYSALEDICAKTNRSRNEIINLLIEYALKHYTME